MEQSVRTLIVQHVAAYADYPRILIHRYLSLPKLIAFLNRSNEVFTPILDPFYGTLGEQRRDGENDIFLVEHKFRAEAAAYIRRQDTDRIGRLAQSKRGNLGGDHSI